MTSSNSRRNLRTSVFTGHPAPSASPQMVVPGMIPIRSATSTSTSRSSRRPCPRRSRSVILSIQPVPSRHGVHWPHDSWLKNWQTLCRTSTTLVWSSMTVTAAVPRPRQPTVPGPLKSSGMSYSVRSPSFSFALQSTNPIDSPPGLTAFAADVGPGPAVQHDVQVEPAAEDVLAEQLRLIQLVDGGLQGAERGAVFVADVEVRRRRLDGVAGDQDPFEHLVGVLLHQDAV